MNEDRAQFLEFVMKENYGYCLNGFPSRMIDLAGLPERVANAVVDYIQHTVLTYLLNNDRESNVNIKKLWGGKQ